MIRISENKNKNEKKQGKNAIIILLAVVAVAAIGVAVWALLSRNTADSKRDVVEVTTADGKTETVAVLENRIDLPQFAWLNLTADSQEQELTFQNPPQNFAYIRVSILLPDKTVLWTSEIIPPGGTSEKVVLSKALAAGTYQKAILKYECFQDAEGETPLNGAENTLDLKVY